MSNTIIKNLIDAHRILSEIHDDVFDLHTFKQVKKCGTIACAAGWLAMSDRFAPIMRLEQTDTRFYGLLPTVGEPEFDEEHGGYDFSWLDEHFGPSAFDNLFAERGSGYRDHAHPGTYVNGQEWVEVDARVTDKELALWRIQSQIDALQGVQA